MSESDDETPRLSAHTLAALAEFEAEQKAVADAADAPISENWQLSQFWYDERTADALARECLLAVDGGSIACVSCPTLFERLLQHDPIQNGRTKAVLFEFDDRFFAKYGNERAFFYDYRQPLDLPADLRNSFDLIIVDPPFLAEECVVKVAQTVRWLSKPNAKIIACSGAIMEELFGRLLGVKRRQFQPTHKNNLANEFACFANFDTEIL
uniref:Protein-lysine N-methyltransferase n=1 Tax=Plectus sambesii TaxID=2011161 RepID=A0A914VAB6_9BILA